MRKVKPEARITVYLGKEDPDNKAHTGVKRFVSYLQVSTSLAFGGLGTASVTLNSKDSRLFSKIAEVQLNTPEKGELAAWKKFMTAHAAPDNYFDYLKKVTKVDPAKSNYKILTYPFSAINLIWIDARGRDGKWYAIFSGVIVGISDSESAGVTPTIMLHCSTWYYFANNYPIVVGLNNLGRLKEISTPLTMFQTPAEFEQVKFSGWDVLEIFKSVIEAMNICTSISADDTDKIFEGRYLWEYLEPLNEGASFEDSFYAITGLDIPANMRSESIEAFDYFPTAGIGYAYIHPRFTNYEIFKRLIRSKFEFYTIEKEYASNIFEKIANSVFSDIFVDALGNLRIELPNYNSCPNVDNEYSLKFHGTNYFITRKDASFISRDTSFDSTKIITFVSLPFTWLSPASDLTGEMIDQRSKGYSQSSDPKDYARYGLREFASTPIFSDFLPLSLVEKQKESIVKIADALRIKLNHRATSITYNLNQRPDFELNKTVLNVDKGTIHLITSISHNIVANRSHTTNIVCEYDRPVGELLPNPWKELEGLNSSLKEEFDKKEVIDPHSGIIISKVE